MNEPAFQDHVEPSAAVLYMQAVARKRRLITGLVLLVFLLGIFALNAGAADTHPLQVLRALLGMQSGISSVVVWNIRLPRLAAAMVAGAALSAAGCVMQTSLRNPLASPFTLGISNAAAFGANLAIVVYSAGTLHSSAGDAVFISNPYAVTLSAFLFSMLGMIIILLLASLRGFSPESVVLSGIALGSLFTAGSVLVQYFAEDVQVAAMVFWTFGDLGRISWGELAVLFTLTAAAMLYFLLHRWDYNAIQGGEDTARGLGVAVGRVRLSTLFAASVVTAAAVSFLGIIGFIGLIAPHMMRRVIGIDHRFLVPASAVTGAGLLLLSDTLARTMISPVVLPVGAITSFFGAPLFLFILVRGVQK